MGSANDKVQALYDKAFDVANAEVKRLALELMREDENLVMFTIAMGTYFFTMKNDNNIHPEELGKGKELFDFITEWDRHLYLSGAGWQLFPDGKVKTEW